MWQKHGKIRDKYNLDFKKNKKKLKNFKTSKPVQKWNIKSRRKVKNEQYNIP